MRRTRFCLHLILALAIAEMVCAMLAAWQRFDYRASGFVFCGVIGGILTMQCLARLDKLRDEIDETDYADPIELKCCNCGEIYKYHPLKQPPEGRENERPLRCPICGGVLEEVKKAPDGGDKP